MIGELNRDNPYLVKLNRDIDPLESETILITKEFIRTAIRLIIYGILSLLFYIYPLRFAGMIFPAILCVEILVILFLYRTLQDIIIESPVKDIYNIIYGNKYEAIYVNNEILLNLIQNVAAYRGRMALYIDLLKYTKRIFLIGIPVSMITRFLIFIL